MDVHGYEFTITAHAADISFENLHEIAVEKAMKFFNPQTEGNVEILMNIREDPSANNIKELLKVTAYVTATYDRGKDLSPGPVGGKQIFPAVKSYIPPF